MTWVKIDDRIGENPKILAVTIEARWTYLVAIAYCARHLTDGFIPAGALGYLGDDHLPIQRLIECIAELVDVGLLEEAPGGGLLVHDYLEYNPTKAEVQKARETRRAIARAGGRARAAAAGRAAGGRFTGVENAVDNGSPPAGKLDEPPAGSPAAELEGQPGSWTSDQPASSPDQPEVQPPSWPSTSPVPVPVVEPGSSSLGSSSLVPDPSAEPPTSNADDLPDELDPTSAHLVRQIRKRAPAFAEQVHGSQLARLQAERGPTIVREAMIALSAMEAPTTVRAWPAYLDEVVDRAAADVARWEAEKQRLRKPEPAEQGGGSDATEE